MNLIIKFLLILFLLISNSLSALTFRDFKDTISINISESGQANFDVREDVDKRGKKYFSIGAGMAPLYKSDQRILNNQLFPVHVYGEFGFSKQKLSYFADLNFMTEFNVSDYVLRPVVLNLDLKYSFIRTRDDTENKFDFFVLGGPNVWHSSLTDARTIGNTENSINVMNAIGVGINCGSGVSYKFGCLKVSALFLFQTGWADYYTGSNVVVNMEPGSYQAVVLVGYCFSGKKHTGYCPAY